MAEWHVRLDSESEDSLWSFVNDSDNECQILNEHLVDRHHGLKIEVFSQEHPPPHFRVKIGDLTGCFKITNGEPLKGSQITKYHKRIKKWYDKNKNLLISAWNTSRPSDCPVGPISEEPTQDS
ncbi:DUF4160 domain-containing protein [bacterium]|nr:DUF4160 domain-containing protein [bacterium]